MKIMNEAARLFFAMTALILVGLLSAPLTGDLNLQPSVKANVTKVESSKVGKDKKIAADKVESKKIKLRKS